MQHSNIVGGSTAKRVINCPGSVALVQKMPPKPSSKYADEGTLLHDTIAEHLATLKPLESFLGKKYEDQVLTQELIDDKLVPALALLDEIDRIYAPCASSGNSLLGRGPDNYVTDLVDGAHVCLVSRVTCRVERCARHQNNTSGHGTCQLEF